MAFDLGAMFGGALSGGISGAAMSGGNPYAIGAGALLGGGMGAMGSNARNNAAASQRSTTDAAMRRLQQLSQQQYAARMEDVNKAMSFYGPARQALAAYGEPTPQMWGPNGPPPPAQAPQSPFNTGGATMRRPGPMGG